MSRHALQGLAIVSEDRPIEAFEQLDRMLQIITPRRWLWLAVVFFCLASFGVFSCLYKAPLKVDGRGIILARQSNEGDSLFQITAPAAGRLTHVDIRIGAVISPGQVIGEIDQSELRDKIRETEGELARFLREDEELTALDTTESASRAESWDQLDKTLHHILELDQSRLGNSRKIAAADRNLNTRRMLSDSDALKSRSEADAIESSIGSKHVDLEELNYQRILDRFTRRREKMKRGLAIQACRIKLDLEIQQLKRDSRIVSDYAGKVVDLMMTAHALIEKGAPAALLEPLDRGSQQLEARLFVPAGMGKRVQVGHSVEVSPDTTRRHEHGYIRGVVQSVSEIPATEMAMLADLKHKTLVDSFVEQYAGQVLLSIRVELPERSGVTDEREVAPNRLDWSSRSGRRQIITPGTLCSASIVVERRPLISLALPWTRELIGLY